MASKNRFFSRRRVKFATAHTKQNNTIKEVSQQSKSQVSGYVGIQVRNTADQSNDRMKIMEVKKLTQARIRVFVAGGAEVDKRIAEANKALYKKK